MKKNIYLSKSSEIVPHLALLPSSLGSLSAQCLSCSNKYFFFFPFSLGWHSVLVYNLTLHYFLHFLNTWIFFFISSMCLFYCFYECSEGLPIFSVMVGVFSLLHWDSAVIRNFSLVVQHTVMLGMQTCTSNIILFSCIDLRGSDGYF